MEDTFGELAAEVAAKYLAEYEKGRYRLKEEYARWVALCTACPEQSHFHTQSHYCAMGLCHPAGLLTHSFSLSGELSLA